MISIFKDNDDWRQFHNASVAAEKRGNFDKAHKEAVNAFLAYDGPVFPNGYAFNALRRRVQDLARRMVQ